MNSFRLIHFIVLALLLGSSGISAQEKKQTPRRMQKLLNEAADDYAVLEYANALNKVNQLLQKAPDYSLAWLLKGQILEDSGKSSEACISYIQAVNLDSLLVQDLGLRIAELLFLKGDYDSARNYWGRINSADINHSDSQKMGFLKSSLDFAREQIAHNGTLPRPKSLSGANSDNWEYFPSLTVDGKSLVFTKQLIDTAKLEKRTQGQEDLYQAQLEEYKLLGVIKLPEPLNSDLNEGTQTLRQDGRLMIFTACNRPDSKGGCDLYHSIQVDRRWTEPVNLGYPVNTRYWESTPCLGPDGYTLYFASNRPGGQGGMDLWMSHYNRETGWQEPINLGPPVNTTADEMAPFLHGDGKSLYFATKGHIGMGGFDIFLARKDSGGAWGQPINLGFPINTYADEFGITIPGSGEFAVFSSDRDSVTQRDLYIQKLREEIQPDIMGFFTGIVVDSLSQKPIRAHVEIRNQTGTLFQYVESDPNTGKFLVGLPVDELFSFIIRHPGYLFYSEPVKWSKDASPPDQGIHMRIALTPVQKGKKLILNQLFFEFDSSRLKPESSGEINQIFQLLKENPNLRLLITGHTDSSGSEAYNLRLSLERAESIRTALVSLGINAGRIETSGAGSSQPIQSNESATGRALNRRTEMTIL